MKALKALQEGSEEELGWFIDRYSGYVAAVVCNILGGSANREDLEELCSDTFVALWQGSKSIRSGSVKGWLARVARNKTLDLLRKRGESPLRLEEDCIMLSVPGPETEAEKSRERLAVRMAVLDMPHPDREIFLRHYFYFQSVGDIAAAMEIPANTVKTRLRRGREKLKACLEGEIQEAHL